MDVWTLTCLLLSCWNESVTGGYYLPGAITKGEKA